SSQGQHTIHRLGRSVQVYMHTDRWEMPDCAVTGMDGVQVPRGKERDFVTHVAYRLEALARRRIAAWAGAAATRPVGRPLTKGKTGFPLRAFPGPRHWRGPGSTPHTPPYGTRRLPPGETGHQERGWDYRRIGAR